MIAVDAPLVRDRDGAILGIDFRRTELSPIQVPGVIEAKQVMLGDEIRAHDVEGVVYTKRSHGTDGTVYLGVMTSAGAEILLELRSSERVRVTAVGAFDR